MLVKARSMAVFVLAAAAVVVVVVPNVMMVSAFVAGGRLLSSQPTTSTFVPNGGLLSPCMQERIRTTQLSMCICIDCSRVVNCKAYHFVETKHSQPHMTENPTFTPRDGSPTIHVNIRTIRTDEDRKKEMERMWSEHKEETMRAEAAAGDKDGPLHGEKKYDLSPVTTYEYDVVKCADFDEDPGCWVRNMPQEIKDANPEFVPT